MNGPMKALIVSDLHANEPAFRAVLRHVRRKRFDHVVCLGDLVGYGAQPNQVLDELRSLPGKKIFIRGNHDRVVASDGDARGFNSAARAAVLWTRDHLSGTNRNLIDALTPGPVRIGDLLFCHGSPVDEDEYLFNEDDARAIFEKIDARIVFFGHTHLPVVIEFDPKRERLSFSFVRETKRFQLRADRRYLINPGSVGQPRDRNAALSFMLFDEAKGTAQFYRLPYELALAQDAILRAGLPRILADRLRWGH